MAEQTPVTPAPPPSSLREHRERKTAAAVGGEVKPPAPPAEKQASAVPEGETDGKSASPTQETQEKPRPRAKTAEERAAELRANGRIKEAEEIEAKAAEQKEFEQWKAGKADRDREAEELRRLRTQASAAAAPPPPAPETKAAPVSADKPKLKDFVENPANAGKQYHEVVEEWEEAVASWRDNQREAKAKTEATNKTVAEKEKAAREAHADYESVMTGQNFVDTIHRLHRDAVVAASLELPNGVEVLYRLAKDPAECRRIAGLSPYSQVIEIGVMSRAIAAPPEKPKPQPVPISKTPPPARNLGGIMPSETVDTTKPPSSLAEHRARKAARQAS